jgi:hypothetical protein
MSFTTACPNCDARLQAPDTVEGKRVKCKKCGEAFVARPLDDDEDRPARSVAKTRPRQVEEDVERPRKSSKSAHRPNDEDEERPRRRARDEDDEPRPKSKTKGKKKKKAGSPVLLFVLLGVGALVFVGGGIGAYVYFSDEKKADDSNAKGGTTADTSTPGKGGWVQHVDAEGKYRVLFPTQPQPQTHTSTFQGMQVTFKAMVGQLGQVIYGVHSAPLPDPGMDPEAALAAAEQHFQAEMPPGVKITDKKDVIHAGVKGREFGVSVQNGAITGVTRIFVANGRICSIEVLGAGVQPDSPNVKRFFDSLKFE